MKAARFLALCPLWAMVVSAGKTESPIVDQSDAFSGFAAINRLF